MHNADHSAADKDGNGLSALDGQRRPLVALAIGLLAGFCLLLAGLLAWSAWHAWHAVQEDSRVATANMARALASHAETSIKLGDAVLDEMVERVEHDGLGDAAMARLTGRRGGGRGLSSESWRRRLRATAGDRAGISHYQTFIISAT